jgi:hypothetical protein
MNSVPSLGPRREGAENPVRPGSRGDLVFVDESAEHVSPPKWRLDRNSKRPTNLGETVEIVVVLPPLSRFGGKATTTSGPSPVGQRFECFAVAMGLDRDFVALPASDNVSTFRGEGVEPDVVALAVADHVLTFRDDRFPGQREYRTPVECAGMGVFATLINVDCR